MQPKMTRCRKRAASRSAEGGWGLNWGSLISGVLAGRYIFVLDGRWLFSDDRPGDACLLAPWFLRLCLCFDVEQAVFLLKYSEAGVARQAAGYSEENEE